MGPVDRLAARWTYLPSLGMRNEGVVRVIEFVLFKPSLVSTSMLVGLPDEVAEERRRCVDLRLLVSVLLELLLLVVFLGETAVNVAVVAIGLSLSRHAFGFDDRFDSNRQPRRTRIYNCTKTKSMRSIFRQKTHVER